MRKNKTVTTKDGYTIEKKALTLNLNKDRHYTLYYKGDRVIGNATYKEIFWILKFLREVKQTVITIGNN